MTARDIMYGTDARERIGYGVDQLANAVMITLGPRGRNVVLDKPWGPPTLTKDGVSVANEIELYDHFANLGAQMVKEVARETSSEAGDGTTTATVLARAIYAEGLKLVSAGIAPRDVKHGIESAVALVVEELGRQSKPVHGRAEIAQVGTVSANGDSAVGAMIAEAIERVGEAGVVTLEEGTSMHTTLKVVDGMEIERGFLSPYFVTDPEKLEAVLTDALVLVHERRISSMQEIVPLLELAVAAGRSLLILAEDIDGDALTALVVNKLKGTLEVCAVKAPGFGAARAEMLEDIAALTGARAFSEALGMSLDGVTLADLGKVGSVKVGRDRTVLVDGGGGKEAIAARLKQLRTAREACTSDYDREALDKRIARLGGGVAVIEIGATSETELKERKARYDDALSATRAAIEEGIVPGGGVALLRAIPALERRVLFGDARYGLDVVRRAVEAPLRQMAQNAGVEGAVVVARVRAGEGAFGYNVATGEYEDLLQAGIIDPTKVVRVALTRAASVAALMLTTDALVVGHVEGGGSNPRGYDDERA